MVTTPLLTVVPCMVSPTFNFTTASHQAEGYIDCFSSSMKLDQDARTPATNVKVLKLNISRTVPYFISFYLGPTLPSPFQVRRRCHHILLILLFSVPRLPSLWQAFWRYLPVLPDNLLPFSRLVLRPLLLLIVGTPHLSPALHRFVARRFLFFLSRRYILTLVVLWCEMGFSLPVPWMIGYWTWSVLLVSKSLQNASKILHVENLKPVLPKLMWVGSRV